MTVERISNYPYPENITSIEEIGKYLQRLWGALQESQSERIEDFDQLKLDNVPWVDVRVYAKNAKKQDGLANAISIISTTETTLLIPNQQDVTADATVPSTMTLKFTQGGSLNISGTKTVTINGHVEAGLFQIFEGDGTVSFGAGSVKEVYPEWWGENTTPGTTDMTAEINSAKASTLPILFQDTIYLITTGLTLTNQDQGFFCENGEAIIRTANDIDAITISKRVHLRNIRVEQTGTSTKAGIKFVDGALYGRFYNIKATEFKYPLEMYSSTSAGISYNDIYSPFLRGNDGSTGIYIHTVGDGWANENSFVGGKIQRVSNGYSVVAYGNQNKFIGTCFEGNDEWLFLVKEYGGNYYSGCRFETNGYGIYVENELLSFVGAPRVVQNYWVCKAPRQYIEDGTLIVQEGTFAGLYTAIDSNRAETTVDANSNSGQKVLNVTATTGFYVKDQIIIDAGGDKEELGGVGSIQDGVSLTMTANLRYSHTAVAADTVEARCRRHGIDYYKAFNKLDFYVHGTKVANMLNTGVMNVLGAVNASTAPTP